MLNSKQGENRKKQEALLVTIMLTAGLLFFFFFGRHTGYVLHKDSEAYIDVKFTDAWAYGSMPGYNFVIAMIKSVIGETYLDGVVMFQGIFAIVSSMAISFFLRMEFGLGTASTLIVYLFTFFPYSYSLPD